MNPNELSTVIQNDENENEDDHNDIMNTTNNLSSYSPSFSTYTANTHIADIASRVAAIDFFSDDFEFSLPVDGDSMPVYPVFNRDSLGSDHNPVQLRKLFFQEDCIDNNNNYYYYDDQEIDAASPGSYCLWVPKSPSLEPASASPSRVMKSSSTGSGPGPDPVMPKAWRLRNLLRRCKSDGKEGLMLVSSGDGDLTKKKTIKEKSSRPTTSSGRGGGGGGGGSKEVGVRRKSYLPYKPDILGFFGSPQTLRSINIPPF